MPLERSSSTMGSIPASASARTTCAPIYPAPPVTIHRMSPTLTARRRAARRRRGGPGRCAGCGNAPSASARSTASAISSYRAWGTRAIDAPPKPPPVSRAPIAPALIAASTAASIAGTEISKSSRIDACEREHEVADRGGAARGEYGRVSRRRGRSPSRCAGHAGTSGRRRASLTRGRSSSVSSRSDATPMAAAPRSHASRRSAYPPVACACSTRESITIASRPSASRPRGITSDSRSSQSSRTA